MTEELDQLEEEHLLKVKEWKAEEVIWLQQVVQHRSHPNLENPYEPKKEYGEICLCSTS